MSNLSENQLFPYRPLPFYYITTHDMAELTYEKFYADLSDMKAKGYGGVIPFNRPPEGFNEEQYFTEDWFTMLGNCIQACHDLGLRVWLNDDFDCPAGAMGGRMKQLAPHLIPLRLRLNGDTVSVEEVDWGFPAYEHPETAPLFQRYSMEEYKRRFGKFFGNTIEGIFCDSDARRCNSNALTPGHPMRDYFPWSADFSQTFREAYGYEIEPYLPSIIRREPSQQSHDYWEHNGNLYFGWFRSNYEWCKENGLEYTFHTSDSAPFPYSRTPFNSAFAEGKAIEAGIHCDYPGTDHETLRLNGNPFCLFKEMMSPRGYVIYGEGEEHLRTGRFYDVYADLRAKQAQSCAFLHDKKGVMCEMFAGVSWAASYKDLRNITSWQLMQGVTFVVLQAYHYRIHGLTKNFAPLSFGRKSHTDFDMKAYNDAVSDNAYRCAQGKLKVDIALLDATDAIWAGSADSETELLLAKQLNHAPQGYVIADMKAIEKKAASLRAVVSPNLPLTQQERDRIRELGLLLIEAEEAFDLAALEEKIPTGIRWEGAGQIMFMRRTLDDGEEMLIIGNIESDDTLTGKLHWGEKTYDVELTSGELAFLGGPLEQYRTPAGDVHQLALPLTADVKFLSPNIIPLQRWENQQGKSVTLTAPESRLPYEVVLKWCDSSIPVKYNEHSGLAPQFRFRADAALPDLRLLVSKAFFEHLPVSLEMDGKVLEVTGTTEVLGDAYLCLACPVAEGEHTITLRLPKLPDCHDLIFLQGSFDASVATSGDIATYGRAYSLTQFLPDRVKLTLSPRRSILTTNESWTEQGQPFYSGVAEYCFKLDISQEIRDGMLVFPEIRDATKVWLDDDYLGSAIFPPYQLPINASKGKHTLRVQVANTLGNQLDGYKAPSGILKAPYIRKDK